MKNVRENVFREIEDTRELRSLNVMTEMSAKQKRSLDLRKEKIPMTQVSEAY